MAVLPTPEQIIDPETMPYWEAAQRGELILPHCVPCGSAFWYPRGFCPRCGGTEIEWRQSLGTGSVYSYTLVRRSSGDWARHVPYCLAQVTLDDGVTVAANVVGTGLEDITIGTAVRAVFEHGDGGSPALRFAVVGR